MKRRDFIKALGTLGAFIGALALGAKAKIKVEAPSSGTTLADAGERVVKGITGGIGRGSPWIVNSPGVRIDLDGTLYASGEFLTIGDIDASPVVRWNGNTWSQ